VKILSRVAVPLVAVLTSCVKWVGPQLKLRELIEVAAYEDLKIRVVSVNCV